MPHVIIIGAGPAGTCLAHGLRRQGFRVSLHERDPIADPRGQGYRLHIGPEGDLALRDCLPAADYDLILATSGRRGAGLTVFDSALNTIQEIDIPDQKTPGTGRHLVVDRQVFRRIMLAGLGEVTRFGAEFTRYEELGDGRVRAHFADGHSETGDLLVAAEGANSPVRKQFLPQAEVTETGQTMIFGKTELTARVRESLPPRAVRGFSTVIGGNGVFLPLAGFEFSTDPNEAAARAHPGLSFVDTRDYVMWVAVVATEAAGALHGLDGAELRKLVGEFVADWHPSLVEIVSLGDPATVHTTLVRTSTPLEHWRSGPVTLVGDAIHPMVPAGASAAVALRDAGLLARRLGEAEPGGLTSAVHDYEVEMLDYGFAAVAASRNSLG